MIDADAFLNEFKDLSKEELIERIHKLYAIVEEDVRIKFLALLNKLDDDQHFETIENYFISDSNAEVRIEAAKLLAFNYEGKKALKPLIWVIKNEEDLDVKLTAIRLLVALSYREEYRDIIEKSLKNLLKCKEDKIKIEVIQSIGILNIQSAYKDLISLLGSTNNSFIKTRAIQSLGELKCTRAVPLLLKNLGKESYDLWYFAFHALKKTVGNNLKNLLVQKLKTLKNNEVGYEKSLLQKGIIKALGRVGDKDQARILLKFLDNDHYWVRCEVKTALDNLEPEWRAKYEINKQ